MIVSRNDTAWRLTVSSSALVLWLAGSSQSFAAGGPITLLPSPRLDQAFEESLVPPPDMPSAPAGISVEAIPPLPEASSGLLNNTTGGFSIDIWQGTPQELVGEWLPRLPLAARTPAARDLARRLLLTEALPPEGADAKGFLTARINSLLQLGFTADATRLAETAESGALDENTVRSLVEARLANDMPTVCKQASDFVQRYRTAEWSKLLIVCQIADGDKDAAALGTAMLREEGENDPLFFALIDAATNATPFEFPKDATSATPLQVALARIANISLPDSALSGASSASLALDTALRFEAALQAAADGAIDNTILTDTASAITFSPDEIRDALTVAKNKSRTDAIALLYRAAKKETLREPKLELVSELLKKLQSQEKISTPANLALSFIDTLAPARQLGWFAPDAAAAYYAQGQANKAHAWHALALEHVTSHPETTQAVERLWPFAILAFPAASMPSGMNGSLTDWLGKVATDKGSAERTADTLVILEALGFTIPAEAWQHLLSKGATSSAASVPPILQAGLDAAAQKGRMGETILLALIAAGTKDASSSAQAIKGLRRIGLEADARAIAREALAFRWFE